MKRYWMFSGLNCYPEGGAYDLTRTGDSIDSLVELWKSKAQKTNDSCWCHIFDSQERRIVDEWSMSHNWSPEAKSYVREFKQHGPAPETFDEASD